MPLLLRYLLRELLVPLVLWVAFVFLLLFVLQFLRGTEVLLGSAVRLEDLGRFILYLSPQFLVMALPVALLLAILVGMGRLAEDRELTALGALGVGPLRLLLAPLLLGVVLSTLMAGLTFRGMPWGIVQVKGLVSGIIKRNVAGDVKAGQFYEELPALTVYAEEVDAERGRWTHVLLHDDRDPVAPLLVLARQGRLHADVETEELELHLGRGQVHRADADSRDYVVLDFERGQLAVGVESAIHRKNRFRSPREELTPEELLQVAGELERTGGDGRAYRVAFHSRLGQTLVPLAFALLGTPLAMGRRGAGRGFGVLWTLVAYVTFYVLNRAFEQVANRGQLPPLVAGQLTNLLFALVGVLLLWRIARRGARA
jgi:lipopolysaccharide export system permease protein